MTRCSPSRTRRPQVSRWGPTAGALLLIGLAVAARAAHASPSAPTPLEVGRAIYLKGLVGSGAPLEGVREAGGPRTTGAEAACVNCHQHSGFGSGERGNQVLVPPIAGPYL